MRCPIAIYKGPVPASDYATAAQAGSPAKIGIVVHEIIGTEDSANAEFHDPNAHLSAHFGVAGPGDDDPEGTIVQWVDTDDIAYAQMNGNWPPAGYLSVETGVQDNQPWTPPMIASLGRLIAWAAGVYGFPIAFVDHGQPGVTTHCFKSGQPDPNWGNHSCPGPTHLAQMPAVISAAQSTSPSPPLQGTAVNVMTSPTGGYAVIGADGAVINHGGSGFFGAMAGKPLAAAIAAGCYTPTGKGYWLTGLDGAIYAFGDAPYKGAYNTLAGQPSWQTTPIIGVAPNARGGYDQVRSDRAVYSWPL